VAGTLEPGYWQESTPCRRFLIDREIGMADLTPQEMAGKLLVDGFGRTGPVAQALSDPIDDTPIVVTLDELRPYELNPRLTRNPLYDDIKASIRERGLDAPPTITRRPGADHYIIRNGGNTRLSILRKLWSETKNEHFFRISCLFRPWPERGEIVALTGHLAENELHGSLTFIERSLGVDKARELYEQESGQPLSQSELARRLSADGFPVPQSHISRMQNTVRYLLPAIPNVLYGGLGRHQAGRLAVLRKVGELTWEHYAHRKPLTVDFETLFHDVLSTFDLLPAEFSFQRVQDELVGQMAELFGIDYNLLELDIGVIEHRQRAIMRPQQEIANADIATVHPNPPKSDDSTGLSKEAGDDVLPAPPSSVKTVTGNNARTIAAKPGNHASPATPVSDETRLQEHIVSPADSTERLQTIQHMVAEHAGEVVPNFADNVLRAIPIQVGGLFPITDVWYIEPGLDTPEHLRAHIAQFAREIAEEARLADCIEPNDIGIGFVCTRPSPNDSLSGFDRTLMTLLYLLSCDPNPATLADLLRDVDLGSLLRGRFIQVSVEDSIEPSRLSDSGLVKLYRLLRLARRLLDREAGSGET
jgi:ParB family protein of integrating conjugative element (PFGI_1 class)